MPPGMHKFAHFLGNKIHTNFPLGIVLIILYLTFKVNYKNGALSMAAFLTFVSGATSN